MGYSTIIDSLVDNRTINEGSLLRDNKQILRKIEKQLHFFKEVFLLGGVGNNLFFIDWFINNRYVAVLGAYLSNGVNEVVIPLQKELEKCDIISGKVCQVDNVTNYINKGWFLPSPINIDKKFKYTRNRSYFIVMNTR